MDVDTLLRELAGYGITDPPEIIYDPSCELLHAEETASAALFRERLDLPSGRGGPALLVERERARAWRLQESVAWKTAPSD